MKRLTVSVFVGLWVPLIFWAFGADLSERGAPLGFAVLYAPLVAAMAYAYPGWKK